MKNERKIKEVCLQHKYAIEAVILAIELFISGYILSWGLIKPLYDSQFELCEQVARDVYAQKENALLQVPEDFSVNITENNITVRSANNHKGMVVARLQNGELVMTRDKETEKAVLLSILNGIAFVVVIFIIFLLVDDIYEKIKKKFGK